MKTVLRILALSVVSTFTHAATMAEQADALYTRGRAAEQRGDAKVAQLCYQLAIRAKPDHQEAIARIAEIAKAAGILGANNQVTGKLIIPQVQFTGATLDQALKFLRMKSRDLDPLGRGIDIILLPSARASTAQISMDLKNVPLDEALRYTTELAGVKHQWEDGRVLVLSRDQKSRVLPLVSTATAAGNSSPTPAKWVLPKVEILGAQLEEALKYVRAKSKEIDPLSKGLDYAFLDGSGKPTDAKNLSIALISLELHQISMEGILSYIAALSGVSIQIEDARIVARPLAPQSAPATAHTPGPLTWTPRSGLSFQATFVRLSKKGEIMVLRDGKEVVLNWNDLNNESVNQAKRLFATEAERMIGEAVSVLVIPSIQLKRATLEEALKSLKQSAVSLGGPGKGVDYSIKEIGGSRKVDLNSPSITLSLRETSLDVVLSYIAMLTKNSIQIEGNRIVVRPDTLPNSPALAAPVATAPVPAAVPPKSVPAAPASSPANQIHAWTNSSGVTIDAAFVGLDGDAVVIRKEGKEFTIPFSKLDPRSLALAKKLSAP